MDHPSFIVVRFSSCQVTFQRDASASSRVSGSRTELALNAANITIFASQKHPAKFHPTWELLYLSYQVQGIVAVWIVF